MLGCVVTDVGQRIECQWCHNHNGFDANSCDRCGAPLDARKVVSDSGWREAPRLRDLTEVHFGSSSVQVDGGVVPVAEIALDPADSVYFEHHVMLWKDGSVPMSVMSTPGGARRMLGDLPFVLSVAHGPGRVALSRDAAGALIVLPVDPGHQLEVRGHALLAASGTLTYSFTKVPGMRTILMAGTGMYFDQFVAPEVPGVLILHGYGNVFERTLGEGETIQLEPGGFLYKDASVHMEVAKVDIGGASDGGGVTQGLKSAGQLAGRGFRGLKAMRELMSDGGVAGAAGQLLGGGGTALAGAFASNTSMVLMRLTGPGRVGMQSMYQHKATD
jgi:uncharacterized protein (AIM24 family)